VIHDPGFPTERVETCRPIQKKESKVDEVINTIAGTSCAVGIFKTTFDCALAIGKKDIEKGVACGADIALTGLACGAAIYIELHGDDDRPNAPDASPRTLRMNATPNQNPAPTVVAPTPHEKSGAKGGKRGKNAKGSKGKKRAMTRVQVSNHDDGNGRVQPHAHGNDGRGKGHQARGNGHGKGKAAARGKSHHERGNTHKQHGKGGKRR
jgi:hypothetical protein